MTSLFKISIAPASCINSRKWNKLENTGKAFIDMSGHTEDGGKRKHGCLFYSNFIEFNVNASAEGVNENVCLYLGSDLPSPSRCRYEQESDTWPHYPLLLLIVL